MEIRKIGVLGNGNMGNSVAPLNGESGEVSLEDAIHNGLLDYFGLPNWEAFEKALEGCYALGVNPLPSIRRALRDLGLEQVQVLFSRYGGAPGIDQVPCVVVYLSEEILSEGHILRQVTTIYWGPEHLRVPEDGVPIV